MSRPTALPEPLQRCFKAPMPLFDLENKPELSPCGETRRVFKARQEMHFLSVEGCTRLKRTVRKTRAVHAHHYICDHSTNAIR